MQMVYDNYGVLSLGIIIGPGIFILGLFLKKKRLLSRTMLVFGAIYFVVSLLLIYQFYQGEKEIAKQREGAGRSE